MKLKIQYLTLINISEEAEWVIHQQFNFLIEFPIVDETVAAASGSLIYEFFFVFNFSPKKKKC